MSPDKKTEEVAEETTATEETVEEETQEAPASYRFDESEENNDPALPLKDRVLVITKTQDYRLSYQDMHNMRAMYIKDRGNAENEIARAEAKRDECDANIAKWDAEIALVNSQIPELAKQEGVESPIQKKDLEGEADAPAE